MKLLLVLLLFFINACSGDALVKSTETNTDTELAIVTLSSIHHPSPDANGVYPNYNMGDRLHFRNNQGYEIQVHEARLSWKDITFIASGSDPECDDGFDVKVNLYSVENLNEEDFLTNSMGQKSIPRQAYCSYEILMAPFSTNQAGSSLIQSAHDPMPIPQDHDHENHDQSEMDVNEDESPHQISSESDSSIHLKGSWSKNDESGDFHLHTIREIRISKVFQLMENGELMNHPFHFHEGEENSSLLFGTKYDVLFDNIDFKNDSHEELQEKMLRNVKEAVHQHHGHHHSH